MWVASYFTDEDPALHLAVSNDGYEFTALNDGQPVLRGTVGTGQLRDPFIGIGPGGEFHLLATDGWTSPNIVHAMSADLTSWSSQTLVAVMANIPDAHNAWAPEFFFHKPDATYHLIWSSVVEPTSAGEPRDWQNTGQDHRIWHCKKTDFRTVSPAEIFFDPGFSVIDATVHSDNGRYIMAFKDERGTNDLQTSHKCIRLTTFTSPGGPFTEPTGPVSPSPVEGPAFFRRDGKLVMIYDHYLEGRYGAAESTDGTHWAPEVTCSLYARPVFRRAGLAVRYRWDVGGLVGKRRTRLASGGWRVRRGRGRDPEGLPRSPGRRPCG
jgi:hypothetical protein